MGIYRFKLPDIGEGVVEAEITAWHVAIGDSVSEEDPIADAMTDKATIEMTAPVDGVIKSVACEAGDMLAVGAVLVEIEIEGEGEAPEDAAPMPEKKPAPKAADKPSATTAPPRQKTKGKALASPAVRQRAEALGINLGNVPRSGERVTHVDLDAFLVGKLQDNLSPGSTGGPSPEPEAKAEPSRDGSRVKPGDNGVTDAPKESPLRPDETRHKVIGLRRVIATRMAEAKRHIPHFTYVEDIDMTALEDMRARLNENSDKPKLTVLPLLIRAMAITLRDWPQFNARYMDEAGYVSRFDDLNLGIATQTDGGLIVPVVQKAQALSVWELREEIARLAEAARTNSLSTKDLENATTTLTSLGPLGGIVTTPVINRPEVAIFGPNKIREIVVMDGEKPVARKVMNFSLSCDHRVIDGYDAAAMMQQLKARLEDPRSIFLL